MGLPFQLVCDAQFIQHESRITTKEAMIPLFFIHTDYRMVSMSTIIFCLYPLSFIPSRLLMHDMDTATKLVGIDINRPRFDQATYIGRAKHFFIITNPINLFASKKKLDEAKSVITRYR